MRLRKSISILLVLGLLLSSLSAAFADVTRTGGPQERNEIAMITADNVMNKVYMANDLNTVFSYHNTVTVHTTNETAGGSVVYEKITEITNRGAEGIYVRIHLQTASGSAEMEGSSAAGYIASIRDDGTVEVACSYPEEFLSLAQETYLEPYTNVSFSNVALEQIERSLYISADMTYADSMTDSKMIYRVDSDDMHLLEAVEDAGTGMTTRTRVSYDEPYAFPACDVLSRVHDAADAVNLSVAYVAPEYNFTMIQDYRLSASVTPEIDSRGNVKIFTDAALTPDSQVPAIELNGDTTAYVVITTFELDSAIENAQANAVQNAPAVTPLPSAATGADAGQMAAATPLPSLATGADAGQTPAATPLPSGVQEPAPAAATPVPAEEPAPAGDYVYVVKDPSDEYITAGGTAYFVAYADFTTSTTWSIHSADGETTILDKDAANYFGSGLQVSGFGTDTLILSNVPRNMDGWQIQCSFGGFGGPAVTQKATLHVAAPAVVKPAASSSGGSASASSSYSKITGEPATVAQTLANNSVSDVRNRIGSWGWSVDGTSDYWFDSSSNIAYYDVIAWYNGYSTAFHFRAYANQSYYVPVGYDSALGNRSFPSTTDTTTCWAAFGEGVASMSSAAGGSTTAVVTPSQPASYGSSAGSGSLVSGQSNLLVLHTNWSATTVSADTVSVTLEVVLESRSIYTVGRPVSINLNGQTASFFSNAFQYEDNGTHYTTLGSYSFNVTAPGSCSIPLTVSWSYNGTYNNTQIGDLVCSGSVNISR